MIKFPNKTVEQRVGNVCVVQGHETSLRQTALRGWASQAGLPVSGAIITVQGLSDEAVSDNHGGWTFVFPFTQAAQPVTVHARYKNFPRQARTVPVVPRATIVLDPFQF